jgi:hypothetical protein
MMEVVVENMPAMIAKCGRPIHWAGRQVSRELLNYRFWGKGPAQ